MQICPVEANPREKAAGTSVLAIEPRREQAALLRQLVDQEIHGELTLVDSIAGAAAAIERRIPDLILISALMAPREEAKLIDRLRALPETAGVRMLFTPMLASAAEPRQGWNRFRLGSTPDPFGCDPASFADQLTAYLDHVRRPIAESATEAMELTSEKRSAVRVGPIDRARAIVNGLSVQLIDLSVTGAQVVSPALLMPGSLARIELARGTDAILCRAGIVWGGFEMLAPTRVPAYRAGVDFRDADRRFLEGLCARRARTVRTTVDMPSAPGRVLFT